MSRGRGKTKSTLQRAFPGVCAATFDAALASYGFHCGDAKLDRTFCAQLYLSDSRYIEISVNAEPREFPFYCNVVLGEGRTAWPERDWNSVALWRFIQHRELDAAALGAGKYIFGDPVTVEPNPEDLLPIFERMRNDLLGFAADFLAGDLRAFRRVRAAQTRQREPYTIRRPDGMGGYRTTVDPESAHLKERFSREDGS